MAWTSGERSLITVTLCMISSSIYHQAVSRENTIDDELRESPCLCQVFRRVLLVAVLIGHFGSELTKQQHPKPCRLSGRDIPSMLQQLALKFTKLEFGHE